MDENYEQDLFNKISRGLDVKDTRYKKVINDLWFQEEGRRGRGRHCCRQDNGKGRVNIGNKRSGKIVVDLLLLGQSRFEERRECAVTTRASMK
jgi:hypothetical protein